MASPDSEVVASPDSEVVAPPDSAAPPSRARRLKGGGGVQQLLVETLTADPEAPAFRENNNNVWNE